MSLILQPKLFSTFQDLYSIWPRNRTYMSRQTARVSRRKPLFGYVGTCRSHSEASHERTGWAVARASSSSRQKKDCLVNPDRRENAWRKDGRSHGGDSEYGPRWRKDERSAFRTSMTVNGQRVRRTEREERKRGWKVESRIGGGKGKQIREGGCRERTK